MNITEKNNIIHFRITMNDSLTIKTLTDAINQSNLAKFVVGWVLFEFCALIILTLWKIGVLNCCKNRVKELDERVSRKHGLTKGRKGKMLNSRGDLESGENVLY
ncbi:MAG: hypothetical protein [Wufeng shrew rhabdovirus 9]|nr:MAG: hypothetical protein [Wufeng shrew rhabdovirus 9]